MELLHKEHIQAEGEIKLRYGIILHIQLHTCIFPDLPKDWPWAKGSARERLSGM